MDWVYWWKRVMGLAPALVVRSLGQAFGHVEAESAFGFGRRFEHLPQNFDYFLDFLVMHLDGFNQLPELGDEITWRGQQPAEPDEGSHDFDVYADGQR